MDLSLKASLLEQHPGIVQRPTGRDAPLHRGSWPAAPVIGGSHGRGREGIVGIDRGEEVGGIVAGVAVIKAVGVSRQDPVAAVPVRAQVRVLSRPPAV